MIPTRTPHCPCGNNPQYNNCCGRYLDNSEKPATAELLMRSRYTAYTQDREDYLLVTWHHSTRPASLELSNKPRNQWLGLTVKRHDQSGPDHATVEFVARYKINGRAYRLHEISRFVRENGLWFYVEGDILQE